MSQTWGGVVFFNKSTKKSIHILLFPFEEEQGGCDKCVFFGVGRSVVMNCSGFILGDVHP